MENDNRPHIKPGATKYTKGYGLKLFISRLFSFIVVLTAVLIVGIAIFIFIKQPIKTQDGYISTEVVNKMFEPGQKVIVINNKNYNMFTPLKRALTTQSFYEAEIIAGPYGEIKIIDDKLMAIYGKDVKRVNLAEKGMFLEQEYVVRKINKNGSYIEEEYDYVAEKEEIVGLIINE